jgi:hypothetical protein
MQSSIKREFKMQNSKCKTCPESFDRVYPEPVEGLRTDSVEGSK